MSKIIALDAGHGLKTPGKQTLNGVKEWFLNDRIMDIVENRLRNEYDCIVLRTDDTTGAKDISLSARVKIANDANADYLLSMHFNAGLNGSNIIGGLMIFFASANPERYEQAIKLYEEIQSRANLPVNPKRDKVKFQQFYIIRKVRCPALLVENGFMDSTVDLAYILTEEHAKKTAEGVIAFLVNECKLEQKKNHFTDTKPIVDTYTVQAKDTLSLIGKKLGIDWREIAEYNNICSPYIIRKGQILNLPGTVKAESVYYPAYKCGKTTLSNALNTLGIDNSFAFRSKIAKVNNITAYVGSATQNTKLYNLLVAGLLKIA